MAKHIEFWTLLRLTQEYISQHYASALTDKNKLNQLKSYIDKYLRDNDYGERSQAAFSTSFSSGSTN